MTDYVTSTTLASYLQLPEESIPAGAVVINLTNGLIQDIVGELETTPSWVTAIALEVAARGWRNPQAYTSVTVGIDDYDKTVRREGKGVDKVGVYLTDDEKADLLELNGVRRNRVGSIQLSVPDA
jgi:hypothetical protein